MRLLSKQWQTAPRQAPADPGLVLLRSVCHELRPPVSTLKSLVRALEASPGDVRHAQLAQLATEHAAYAESVLSQAAAAAYGLAEPAGPAVPLDQVLAVVTSTVPADRLLVRIGRGVGRRLVHPQHLRQIVGNLLANAERHGPAGGLIRLDARGHRRGLRLTVADDGRLTADLCRSLSRATPPDGEKGLGLWVVRHLVASHGGGIRARPLHPRGVAVEVTLPRLRH